MLRIKVPDADAMVKAWAEAARNTQRYGTPPAPFAYDRQVPLPTFVSNFSQQKLEEIEQYAISVS